MNKQTYIAPILEEVIINSSDIITDSDFTPTEKDSPTENQTQDVFGIFPE